MGFAYNNRTEESWSESLYYGCTPLPLLANNTVVEQPVDLNTLNQRYTDHAVKYISDSLNNDENFFLYFAYGHVHTPQYANPDVQGTSERGIFGDSVTEVMCSHLSY